MLILGIDYGTKRVGFALGDTTLGIIKPLKIVKKDENLLNTIKGIVKSYNVQRIVLGYPLTPLGKEGQRAKKVRRFYELLRKELNIEIMLFDERYSTQEARRLSQEEHIDHISAYIILEEYVKTL